MAGKAYRCGTHRVVPPEATWRRIQPVLRTAGVTRVADVTGLDRLGLPVFQAIRPASLNLAVSQGKGATVAAARVSAAMEALELWHAEDLSDLPCLEISPAEMAASNAVPAEAIHWAAGPRFPHRPVDWLPARRLAPGVPLGGDGAAFGETELPGPAHLPRAMIELDFTVPETFEPRPFHQTSNGLASGNCLPEALLHGICEVVERHAVHLARRRPAGRRPLRLGSLGAAEATLVEAVHRAGMEVALYDVTWEAGLPTVVADLAAPDLPTLWRGSGCHPSPGVAVSRALTEAVQTRLTYIAGARDDLPVPRSEDSPGRHLGRLGRDATGDPVALADLPDLASDRVDQDLDRVLERLERLGLHVWWVDLTRPHLDLPVVRVVVPGLEEDLHH